MNLVLAAEARHALLHFFHGVGAADGFHLFVFVGVFAVAAAVTLFAGRARFVGRRGLRGGGEMVAGLAMIFAAFRHRRGIGRHFAGGRLGGRRAIGLDIAHWAFVGLARFLLSVRLRYEIGGGRRRRRHFGLRRLLGREAAQSGFAGQCFHVRLALAGDLFALHHVAIARSFGAAMAAAIAATSAARAVVGVGVGVARVAFFLRDQRLPVGNRDLVVVGMDFGERQEAVAVAAVIDERRLQRRFDARNFGEIDVTAKLLAVRGLEVEFLDAVAAEHHDPGLLRMGRVDQHFVGHW